jgi:hypothetical protein
MPPTLGTKIMPIGQSLAICCASWPAPLGSLIVLRLADAGRAPDRRLDPARRHCRNVRAGQREVDGRAGGLRDLRAARLDGIAQLAQHLLGEIAELDAERRAPGITFGEFGSISMRPDRADLPPLPARRDVANG